MIARSVLTVIIVSFLGGILSPVFGQETVPGETAEQKNTRMQWWRDAKYGMFIHWGASSLLGGEWNGRDYGDGYLLIRLAKIPPAKYAEALAGFNPIEFNAEQWVFQAKDFGMKYIVFIAKHHDGFALWDTKVSTFNIIDHTPFKRDVLAELAEACAKHDMPLGVYYSHARDWYHPGGAMGGSTKLWDDAQKGDFAEYLKTIAVPQVRELLTGYGKISVMWWDMPDQMTAEYAAPFLDLMALQPGIISNNRLFRLSGGDHDTPERFIPGVRNPDRDIEACMTIGKDWIFTRSDGDWKSPETLLRNLLGAVSKGGNLLLNVSPTPEGVIPEENAVPLSALGEWLEKYGEAVYGTRQGPFRMWDAGYGTAKDGKLYLHVFDWPKDGKLHVPVSNSPSAVYPLTDSSRKLTFQKGENGLVIDVPAEPLDSLASVLVLELNEPAQAVYQGDPPNAENAYLLSVETGELNGTWLRAENGVISNWRNNNYFVAWPIYVGTPGTYRVRMKYSCSRPGGVLNVGFNDATVSARTQKTEGLSDFRIFEIGEISFEKPGTVEVKLTLANRPDAEAVQIKEILIVPESPERQSDQPAAYAPVSAPPVFSADIPPTASVITHSGTTIVMDFVTVDMDLGYKNHPRGYGSLN